MILGIITVVVIFIILPITIYVWLKKKNKQEDNDRIMLIDKTFSGWVQKYKSHNLIMPELNFDKYLDNRKGKTKYIRMKSGDYYITEFFEKDFNSQLKLRKYIETFGEKDGLNYFNNGFCLGLPKDKIIAVLGNPVDTRTEQLKTKTKQTLYYSHIKSNNFYVFDNDELVKIVI